MRKLRRFEGGRATFIMTCVLVAGILLIGNNTVVEDAGVDAGTFLDEWESPDMKSSVGEPIQAWNRTWGGGNYEDSWGIWTDGTAVFICGLTYSYAWGISDLSPEGPTILPTGSRKVLMNFDTPWAPPLKMIEKLSNMFRSLTFDIDFEEENMEIKGRVIYKSGDVFEQID